MAQLDFAVFDADNHLYETEDAFTRHLPASHANLFRFVEINGRKKLVVRNVLTEFIPNPTFEVVARPGAHMAFYAADNPEGKTLRELTGKPMKCRPGLPRARRPPRAARRAGHLRLARCSRRWPASSRSACSTTRRSRRSPSTRSTSGCTTSGPTTTRAASSPRRSSTRACSTRASPSSSCCSSAGAKAVLLRPAPVSGLRGTRSPFLPEFDPFWARIEEAGVVVALHASDSGYQDYLNTWEGSQRRVRRVPAPDVRRRRRRRPLHPGRAGLGHLPRDAHPVPGGQAASASRTAAAGSAASLNHLQVAYKKMPQEFPEHPIEVFHRNIWVNPFWEDSVTGLIDLDRRRPGLLRVGLPAPRGPGRADRVGRRDR